MAMSLHALASLIFKRSSSDKNSLRSSWSLASCKCRPAATMASTDRLKSASMTSIHSSTERAIRQSCVGVGAFASWRMLVARNGHHSLKVAARVFEHRSERVPIDDLGHAAPALRLAWWYGTPSS